MASPLKLQVNKNHQGFLTSCKRLFWHCGQDFQLRMKYIKHAVVVEQQGLHDLRHAECSTRQTSAKKCFAS